MRTVLVALCLLAVRCGAQTDIFFLPCAAEASVSFEGNTQAGRTIHRLEVRRVGYTSQGKGQELPSRLSCVIYHAGDDYGPEILRQMEAIDPMVRRVGTGVVEVYFTTGAHTHVRQRWKLTGHTATLESEEGISWRDDPRTREGANKALDPTRVSRPAIGRIPED